MESDSLITTGVKITLVKGLNTEKVKLPDVKKKDTFLKQRRYSRENIVRLNSSMFNESELFYLKDPLTSLFFPNASSYEESDLHSSYIIIPNKRLQTTAKKVRNITQLPTKREYLPLDSKDFTIEGIPSRTHRKVYKKLEFINLTKPKISTTKKISKIKHNESTVKEIMFWNWISLLRLSNGYEIYPHKGHFRYYIGKGNNSSLVNHILKSRFWWSRTDNYEEAHLIWTQLNHKPTIDKIPHYNNHLAIDKFSKQTEENIPKNVLKDNQESYGFKLILDSKKYCCLKKEFFLVPENLKTHNRLSNNSSICNKKEMFKNMKNYYDKLNIDVFTKVPLTYHIEIGLNDLQFSLFLKHYSENTLWIIKPGESTNRGKGIKVSSSLQEIKEIIGKNIENRTYILQKYIQNPLLINRRKFDIRCYALITSFANQIQGYFFKDGYLRTSCKEFTLKNTKDKFIHLTNDAIQKNHEDYGKYESGNKLSYFDFQKFLNSNGSNIDFFNDIYPQIIEIVTESIASVKDILNSETKLNSFEILGYDFMIDTDYKVWLIEINTNPCLELSCSYLSKIIPDMLENSFKIALDPMFPPPESHKRFKGWIKNYNLSNKYLLVYSSLT